MKKIKILCTVFALSSLLLIPQKAFATEMVTENNTEATTNYDNQIDLINLTDEQKPVENSTEKSTEEGTTYGWVNIVGTVSNCSFNDEFKLKFKFVNTKNNEAFEKEVSSLNSFTNTVKLDYGTYNVSLENSNYADNVTFNKELTVNDNETNFNVLVKNINTDDIESTETTEQAPKTNTALELLKNNIIFLILILACGGYLLYKEIQRRKE